jgi:hypothetical protein
MPKPNEQVQAEYAAWLATPKRLRTQLGLPPDKRSFAEFKGISERSLYRWEKEPAFAKLVEQRKMQLVGASPNAAVAAIGTAQPYTDARLARKMAPPPAATEADDPVYLQGEGLDADEIQYLKVKSTLAQMAADGNQGAMDLFLKHYGKSFIEAERADLNPFSALDDVELVRQVLETIGVEYVADWVAQQIAEGAS